MYELERFARFRVDALRIARRAEHLDGKIWPVCFVNSAVDAGESAGADEYKTL